MKKTFAAACFLLGLTLFTGPAFSRPLDDMPKPPTREQAERIRKRVEMFKMWKLTQSLDLDERTASQLFPLINRYDRKRFAVEQELRATMRQLRRSVDTASGEELQTIVRMLKKYHEKLQMIQTEELKELSDILTVREFARFIIFRQDFDRHMKKMISKARGRRNKDFLSGPEMPQFPDE